VGCATLIGFGDLDVVSASDGGGRTDGPDDGPGDGGPLLVDAGRFCERDAHTFCADFDDKDAGGAWTTVSAPDPGTLDLAEPRSRSAPHAARAQDPRRAAGVYRHVSLLKNLPHVWTRTVVEFDVFVASLLAAEGDSTAGLVALNFKSQDKTKYQGVAFSLAAPLSAFGVLSALADGGPWVTATNLPAIAFDRWIHLTLDVTPGGAVTVHAGDVTATLMLPALAAGPQPSVELEVGIIGFNAPAPAFDLSVDNVTVDFF
jgi:hypothetical protein